ncbi:Transcriptional regulator, LysR family protein [Minicystis rosea]|nr:Transcriptional regulator, LysR family protein [Minicystis rosea]
MGISYVSVPSPTTIGRGIHHPVFGMIDIGDLPLFVAVARASSFVEAARRTGTPTTTVSRAVARLEEALGVRLFQRTSRHVSLTADGERLLARVGPLAEELGSVLDEVKEGSIGLSGRLRVTAPVLTGSGRVARALASFAAMHPRLEIELHLSNAVVDLVAQGFDLGLRAGPIASSGLFARRLWSVPFALGASRAFVERELGGRALVTTEQLTSLPAVTTRTSVRFRSDTGEISTIRLRPRFRVNDPRVAVDTAARGVGLVCAPREAVLAAGLVELATPLGPPEPRSIYAVFPSRNLPKRVRAAIDWIALDRGG